MVFFVRSHKLMIYKIWGYLSLRMVGYRLFKYANMRLQTPNKITKYVIISWTVMYPVYQENHHVFLLGVISYTRDYDPSFDTPENYLL